MADTKWICDIGHSEITFKVRHLMITTVTGYFRKFELIVETQGEDFTKTGKISFVAETDSVDTNNAQRDTHLKSADFFSVSDYPQIKFEGKNFRNKGEGFELTGDLTIRNITKPVTLEVDLVGTVVDPYGQTKAGFVVDGKIRRRDFELTWDAVTEAGQVVVSNDIRIHGEIQLIKQFEETERAEPETAEDVTSNL